MRGRPPKPVVIRALEGNPGKRPIPKVPEPTGGAPECPDWLSDDAAKVWDENAKELENLGLLTSLDGPAFAALCHWFAVFRHYAELHDQRHDAAEGNAIFRAMRDAAAELRRWCSELGLTPVSRTRLALRGHDDGDDPFADLVSKV